MTQALVPLTVSTFQNLVLLCPRRASACLAVHVDVGEKRGTQSENITKMVEQNRKTFHTFPGDGF